ncbi:uncharacterized protein VP01_4822g1 [Puccinia sorghi]|uniref:Retrotransposon gag domain-containing protein n=1 Tax=Puccinia sorghi TaxID=27349 RepID=A0A0L6UMI5_9BASI|nr:uncharacterized protein VP01_4822g1 [Puccinia sorghi]
MKTTKGRTFKISFGAVVCKERFSFHNGEAVVFSDFLNDFKYIFYQYRRHCAKVALRNLHQTGNVLAYTQEFNQNTHTVCWANCPLMSLYQHSLKENIQLAVVMSDIEFDSLQNPTRMPRPQPHPQYQYQHPCPKPNAMELSAFQKALRKQLSEAKKAFWVQRNLCFCCGQAGHISCGFLSDSAWDYCLMQHQPSAWDYFLMQHQPFTWDYSQCPHGHLG